MTPKDIAKTVLATIVGSTLLTSVTQSAQAAEKPTKCYGVSMKGKNDCGTPKHACSGQSTISGSSQEWIYLSKGNCERIVCGSTTSSEKPCKFYNVSELNKD